ncbi:alpha/beta hydrolase fold domain-containing protein [Microtetraspora malaysiensis]|uniref:alpha/beta hydrolase fold domain-containing protein n=1 Tax=Microtetraspora malaysiensis TaxID=161358 RepID=UPI003D8C95FF
MPAKTRLPKRLARRLALGVAIAAAVPAVPVAALIVLPFPTRTFWILTVFAREYSLLGALAALAATAAAVAALWLGARRAGVVTAVVAALCLVATLVPVVTAHRDARRLGVPLSYADYFQRPATAADRGPDATVAYARPGGAELRLDVWRPRSPAEKPGPAVVLVHGGSWTKGRRGMTPRWNEWLTERGATVFDIDYRLAPPATWNQAPGDVRCAVGWVRRNAARYGVDPGRVALMGMSAGGHLALLAAYTSGHAEGEKAFPPSCETGDTSVSAVVSLYGPYDLAYSYDLAVPWWAAKWLSDGEGRVMTHDFIGGPPEKEPAAYRAASPITYLRADVPPTLSVQGGHDQIVYPDDGRRAARLAHAAGASHRYVEIGYAGHAFDLAWGGFGAQMARAEIGDFLRRTIRTG